MQSGILVILLATHVMCTTKELCQSMGMVKCNDSANCVHKLNFCDGYNNCPNGEDEGKICTDELCQSIGKIKCNNSSICINRLSICDGYNDCPNGDDEGKMVENDVLV